MMDDAKSERKKANANAAARSVGIVIVLGACLGAWGVASPDEAAAPFYYASPTPYDQPVRTLLIGVNGSIGQAVVSQDRKAVTLNMDPGLLGSAGIQTFNYERSGMGFVGSTPRRGPEAPANRMTPTIAATPDDIAVGHASALDTPGMVLIEPLER